MFCAQLSFVPRAQFSVSPVSPIPAEGTVKVSPVPHVQRRSSLRKVPLPLVSAVRSRCYLQMEPASLKESCLRAVIGEATKSQTHLLPRC